MTDLSIPTFLLRQDYQRLTNEEATALVESTAGRRSTWWMPGKDWKSTAVSLPEIMARYNGAEHPEQPVSVRVPADNGATELVAYANWAAYEAAHDAKSYPPKRVQSLDGVTVVLVAPKPWAGKAPVVRAQGAVPKSGSKKDALFVLICRDGGATFDEMQALTGWKEMRGTASALAKAAGMTWGKVPGSDPVRYAATAK